MSDEELPDPVDQVTTDHHQAIFSHEFDEGASGPPRSYWDVYSKSGRQIGTLCMHHRGAGLEVSVNIGIALGMLDQAFEAGVASKQDEITRALGL